MDFSLIFEHFYQQKKEVIFSHLVYQYTCQKLNKKYPMPCLLKSMGDPVHPVWFHICHKENIFTPKEIYLLQKNWNLLFGIQTTHLCLHDNHTSCIPDNLSSAVIRNTIQNVLFVFEITIQIQLSGIKLVWLSSLHKCVVCIPNNHSDTAVITVPRVTLSLQLQCT